jgi:hypothetical protein
MLVGSALRFFSFGFVGLARQSKVNDVEPRKNTGKDRPQDRTIPMPGTYDGDHRTESNPDLGDGVSCLGDDLSDDRSGTGLIIAYGWLVLVRIKQLEQKHPHNLAPPICHGNVKVPNSHYREVNPDRKEHGHLKNLITPGRQ